MPTAPARIGTIIRKSLPKIEASGVLVAFARRLGFLLIIIVLDLLNYLNANIPILNWV